MPKTDTVTVGPVTFVVAPEPKQARRTRRPPAPQCSPDRSCLSPGVRCSDGYYRMNYLAAKFEREKSKKWWQKL